MLVSALEVCALPTSPTKGSPKCTLPGAWKAWHLVTAGATAPQYQLHVACAGPSSGSLCELSGPCAGRSSRLVYCCGFLMWQGYHLLPPLNH